MIRGTRNNAATRSGALASIASWAKGGATSSSRMTFTRGTAWDVGSTPVTSSRLSLSMYWRIPLSCSRMRSSSVSLSSRRASRAMWSTSSRVIIGAGSARSEDSVGGPRRGATWIRSATRLSSHRPSRRQPSYFFQVGVLERELFSPDGGEADRDERVTAAPLDADHEPLAPAAVADARADLDGQVVVARVGERRLRLGRRPRLGAARGAEEGEVFRGHLEQEARRLAEAVAVHPAMEGVGDPELRLRARDPDVAEPPLFLELVHRV